MIIKNFGLILLFLKSPHKFFLENNVVNPVENQEELPSITRANFTEIIPDWLTYLPSFLAWLLLGIYYRSFALPCLANPKMSLGGFANESKMQIFKDFAFKEYLPITAHITRTDNLTQQALAKTMTKYGLEFPIIVKPDTGCKGIGVQIISNITMLYDYAISYPVGEEFLLNEFIEYHKEIGVFFIKSPNQQKGFIPSITVKYPFLIKGDGKQTARDYLKNNSGGRRLIKSCELYHGKNLDKIIPKGSFFRVSMFGNHRLGTIFKNGNDWIDDALTEQINHLATGLPEFYFGRFDIKYNSLKDLKNGKNFKIIEINGASSEMTHIWDNRHSLCYLWRITILQFYHLFKIGNHNRKRGFQTPSLKTTWHGIAMELKRRKFYPLY